MQRLSPNCYQRIHCFLHRPSNKQSLCLLPRIQEQILPPMLKRTRQKSNRVPGRYSEWLKTSLEQETSWEFHDISWRIASSQRMEPKLWTDSVRTNRGLLGIVAPRASASWRSRIGSQQLVKCHGRSTAQGAILIKEFVDILAVSLAKHGQHLNNLGSLLIQHGSAWVFHGVETWDVQLPETS